MSLTLLVHTGSTLAMVGLIWFVQLVHYPLMARVGEAGFGRYASEHQWRTSWVVLPLMLAEATTTVLLAFGIGGAHDRLLAISGLALLALIWGSTFLLQVPLHRRLTAGRDASALARLVRTNWLRTAAWSARGVVALGLLATSVETP